MAYDMPFCAYDKVVHSRWTGTHTVQELGQCRNYVKSPGDLCNVHDGRPSRRKSRLLRQHKRAIQPLLARKLRPHEVEAVYRWMSAGGGAEAFDRFRNYEQLAEVGRRFLSTARA